MKSFEELECWKAGVTVRRKVRDITRSFPLEEKYRLTDQMIRASRSVTNCIAEGFGRYHYQENIQFCRSSRGSLNELLDHLLIAREEEYISEEKLKELKNDTDHCLKILNGYINYLLKQKQNTPALATHR